MVEKGYFLGWDFASLLRGVRGGRFRDTAYRTSRYGVSLVVIRRISQKGTLTPFFGEGVNVVEKGCFLGWNFASFLRGYGEVDLETRRIFFDVLAMF